MRGQASSQPKGFLKGLDSIASRAAMSARKAPLFSRRESKLCLNFQKSVSWFPRSIDTLGPISAFLFWNLVNCYENGTATDSLKIRGCSQTCNEGSFNSYQNSLCRNFTKFITDLIRYVVSTIFEKQRSFHSQSLRHRTSNVWESGRIHSL